MSEPRTAIERDDALRTMGEGITDIAMRSLSEDRDLNESEIAAIAFLARNALTWCGHEAATPPVVESLRAMVDATEGHAYGCYVNPDDENACDCGLMRVRAHAKAFLSSLTDDMGATRKEKKAYARGWGAGFSAAASVDEPVDRERLADALRDVLGPEIAWRPSPSDDPWRDYAHRIAARLAER